MPYPHPVTFQDDPLTITGRRARALLDDLTGDVEERKAAALDALRHIDLNPWDHAIFVAYGYLEPDAHQATIILEGTHR